MSGMLPVQMRRGTKIVLAAVLVALPPNLWAQEHGEGPASLFISYQCKPENRAAFRAHMAGAGVNQFDAWRKQGIYDDYLVLFSSYVNASGFDMLVRLDFAKYADSDKWREIERKMPAGLASEALALCSPISSYLADLTWQGKPSAARNLARTTYLVIPYHWHVSKAVYKTYFDAYVKPQVDGWIDENAMSWYGIYLNQHNTGAPWDSLFLLEYQDTQGLARRDNVKWEVRSRLQKNPGWKSVSDSKAEYRREDEVILAEPLLAAGAGPTQ